MVPVVFGLGLVFAIIAAASRAHAAEGPAGSAIDAARRVVATGNAKKIALAAVAAKQAGDGQLAVALATAAKKLQHAAPDAVYKSPFLKPNTEQWNAFVHGVRGTVANAVTPAYHLGLFGFGMRRLVDLGLATNPVKARYKGRTVWDATWKAPATLAKFLNDPELQYQTFVKAMTLDAAAIKNEMPEVIGSTLDGQTVTMSGLLAVSKNAGLAGLRTWVADEAVRKQHTATTAQFHKLNGVF